MELQMNKGQEAIQFIKCLVENKIDNKDTQGNVNIFEI